MTWLNFMSDYKGPHGNFGRKSWERAFDTGTYSGNQIKVALQRQGQAGYSLGSGLKTDYMQNYQGVGHADNPLGKYQGVRGNFGLESYTAAKADGWSAQDIYDEIKSGRSGMFMPKDATAQYYKDIKAEDDAMWAERIADIPTAAELMAEMPQPKIRAGQDYATTGRSAQGMRIKKGTKFAEGGKRGTKGYFGRGAKFTGNSTSAMNIKGGGGGSASQVSNTLNTV